MILCGLFFPITVTCFYLSFDQGYTVSGISSGGYAAVQLQIAYSSQFIGAAVVAGGPFLCSQGSIQTGITKCMNIENALDIKPLVLQTKELASDGLIDPLENLSGHKSYLYHGESDTTISLPLVRSLERMYQFLGVGSIRTRYDIHSGHAWPTLKWGDKCGETKSPFVVNCDFDLVKEFFVYFYKIDTSSVRSQREDHLYSFPQVDSEEESKRLGLMKEGLVYVPGECQRNGSSCKLHVVLHGCQMSHEFVENEFVLKNGVNRWAETHDIIILYPQIRSSQDTNPLGCFDWWGYVDDMYATKKGKQMGAIMKMIQKIQKHSFDPFYYHDLAFHKEEEKMRRRKEREELNEIMYKEL